MSNTLNTDPIIINTAMSTSWKSQMQSVLGYFLTLLVEKIYWEQPANIGDTVTIENPTSGQILVPLRCEVAGQSQIIDWTANPVLWQDFIVPQISSGSLYIYLR